MSALSCVGHHAAAPLHPHPHDRCASDLKLPRTSPPCVCGTFALLQGANRASCTPTPKPSGIGVTSESKTAGCPRRIWAWSCEASCSDGWRPLRLPPREASLPSAWLLHQLSSLQMIMESPACQQLLFLHGDAVWKGAWPLQVYRVGLISLGLAKYWAWCCWPVGMRSYTDGCCLWAARGPP